MDPLDKFLEELAEREKRLDRERLEKSANASQSFELSVDDMSEPDDPRRVWYAVKHYPPHFTSRQVQKACRKHPLLAVRKISGRVVVGARDQFGCLVYPRLGFSREQLEMFVDKMIGQWTIVPARGYDVIWTTRHWDKDHFDVYPGLDEIESQLVYYPSESYFTLHQLMLTALRLQPVSIPYVEY